MASEVPVTEGLIPLNTLLGNPKQFQARISPDGTKLSWLAPDEKDVLNVWVKAIAPAAAGAGEGEAKAEGGGGAEAEASPFAGEGKMVTADKKRGIRLHAWTEASDGILYMQDLDGDENMHLLFVDITAKELTTRDLTPWVGVKASGFQTRRAFPHEVIVQLNVRDRRCFDVHRIDLRTGGVTREVENPGNVLAYYCDPDFKVRAAFATNPSDGGKIAQVRDTADGEWRDLITWPFLEDGGIVGFTADGTGLYVETSIGADTKRLVEVDIKTGEERRTIASNPRCDVGAVEVNEDTWAIEAVSFDYYKSRWQVVDDSVAADYAALQAFAGAAEFQVVSRDHADKTWVVAVTRDDGPSQYHTYRRGMGDKGFTFLFTDRPELEKYTLRPMAAFSITCRDGLEQVAYLTLPEGAVSDADAAKVAPAPAAAAGEGEGEGEGEGAALVRGPDFSAKPLSLPTILFVHGGPWARDGWGFNPLVQMLANRGYAVLQTNYRGSTGYGKAHLNKGNEQWGVGTMQDDLTDAVEWAVKAGVADAKRVAILGGSYGGYACLAGLTFTPELYACGVDIVGPSHIKTLFESVPPYWAPFKKQLILRVGDVEADEAVNRKISPLYHVDKIRVPLLIGHGANDPRVKLAESDQIVSAMRGKGLEVGYIVYSDEGHGFARPENKCDFYSRMEVFLASHLGGKTAGLLKVDGTTADSR